MTMEAKKLTLRLDADVIERGKKYAREQGTSLSKMVERFLKDVTPVPPPEKEYYISDEVRALMFAKDPTISDGSNAQYTHEYYEYLATKHLSEEE